MPNYQQPISPEDLARRRATKTTRVDLAPYIDYMRSIQPGYAGDLLLLPNENKPTIKRRVTMAANRIGKSVKYLRSGENELIFEMQSERKS